MKKNKNNETEFLNYIYKNSEMGIIGINAVITKVKSTKFEKLLQNQKEEYNEICKEAEDVLKKYGANNEENSTMAKISTVVMSEMEMMKDHSDQTIAKMMIEGTNKGIIAITEKINAYNDIDPEIIALANKLKSTLESDVDELKKYL